MSYDKISVGARIRQARRDANLTQDDLARLIGVEQSYISSLERGKKAGSHETLAAIAQAVQVSLDELTGIGVSADLQMQGLPPGLSSIAGDQALRRTMAIVDDEVEALSTLKPSHPLSRDAYLQILIAMRQGRLM